MRIPALEPAYVLPISNVISLHGCCRSLQAPLRNKILGERTWLGMAKPAGNETPSGAGFGRESLH